MKQYYISFLYKKNGLRKIAARFMKPTGKVTGEEIELWMDKIKVLNVFELENGVACPHREYCPSRSGWCDRKNQDYEKCIPYILNAYLRVKSEKDQWRKEAIMMAAAAGEKKIEEFNEKPEGGEKVD